MNLKEEEMSYEARTLVRLASKTVREVPHRVNTFTVEVDIHIISIQDTGCTT